MTTLDTIARYTPTSIVIEGIDFKITVSKDDPAMDPYSEFIHLTLRSREPEYAYTKKISNREITIDPRIVEHTLAIAIKELKESITTIQFEM